MLFCTFPYLILLQVTQAFIDTRMKAAGHAVDEDDIASFFEESAIAEQLHYIPTLCRYVTFTYVQ